MLFVALEAGPMSDVSGGVLKCEATRSTFVSDFAEEDYRLNAGHREFTIGEGQAEVRTIDDQRRRFHLFPDSEVSGVRSLPTAVFLQVVLDWMNSARDIQLS